jgi:hypothetical protein
MTLGAPLVQQVEVSSTPAEQQAEVRGVPALQQAEVIGVETLPPLSYVKQIKRFMARVALATALVVYPEAMAMALMVVVALTVIGGP